MSQLDLLGLYDRASAWTLGIVTSSVDQLDRQTPCEAWNVRALLSHMLDTQRYFVGTARGEDVAPPSPTPPNLVDDDPVRAFQRGRSELLKAFGRPGAIEKTGPSLGIAFADQLLHGWDLATATGQDPTMPEGLAEAAYQMIHGRFTDEQRAGVFGPAIPVRPDATRQEELLAYTGRNPYA